MITAARDPSQQRMTIDWQYHPWAALSRDQIYRIFALRQQVFVVEQHCPFLDADGYDAIAHHLWTDAPDPVAPLAYLRVFGPGGKYREASLGRIVTAPAVRSTGLGRALVAEGLARIRAQFGAVPVRIGAQRYLERFYGAFGFVTDSPEHIEDGIPHVEMVRAP
jgi:ElaA protein